MFKKTRFWPNLNVCVWWVFSLYLTSSLCAWVELCLWQVLVFVMIWTDCEWQHLRPRPRLEESAAARSPDPASVLPSSSRPGKCCTHIPKEPERWWRMDLIDFYASLSSAIKLHPHWSRLNMISRCHGWSVWLDWWSSWRRMSGNINPSSSSWDSRPHDCIQNRQIRFCARKHIH